MGLPEGCEGDEYGVPIPLGAAVLLGWDLEPVPRRTGAVSNVGDGPENSRWHQRP